MGKHADAGRPRPRAGHRQGHGCSPSRRCCPAQGDDPVPRGRQRRSRPTIAAGCILLYDEAGTLKCETCFQCAAACPIECIDMGGVDTKNRFHVHWGAGRAVRRAPRGVGAAPIRPPGAGPRRFEPFAPIDLAPLDAILARERLRPDARCPHPRRRPRRPTATCRSRRCSTSPPDRRLVQRAVRHRDLAIRTCASSRRAATSVAVCRCATCTLLGGGRVLAAFREHLGTDIGGVSPDGAVRLEADRLSAARPAARRASMVDGQVLPQGDRRRRRDASRRHCARTSPRDGHRLSHAASCGRATAWPSILLRACGRVRPARRADIAAAEEAGAWTAWRQAPSRP